MAAAADVDVAVAVADIAIWWSCCCNRSWQWGRGEGKRKCRLVSKQSPTHFSAIFISISFSLHSLCISRSPLSLSPSLSHASAISLWVKFTFYLLRHLSSVAGLELQPEVAGSIGRCGCSTKHEAEARRGPKINAQQMQFVEVNYCVSSLIQLAHDCRVSLIE